MQLKIKHLRSLKVGPVQDNLRIKVIILKKKYNI